MIVKNVQMAPDLCTYLGVNHSDQSGLHWESLTQTMKQLSLVNPINYLGMKAEVSILEYIVGRRRHKILPV